MMKILIAVIVLILLVVFGLQYFSTEKKETITLEFYFPLKDENLEPVGTPVFREVEKTEAIANLTLNLLFLGPTVEEKKQGYFSPFIRDGLEPLISSYERITIENGVASLHFKDISLRYLNAPAFQQMVVKKSIQMTLFQFDSIKEIQYVIEGEVYDAWDA